MKWVHAISKAREEASKPIFSSITKHNGILALLPLSSFPLALTFHSSLSQLFSATVSLSTVSAAGVSAPISTFSTSAAPGPSVPTSTSPPKVTPTPSSKGFARSGGRHNCIFASLSASLSIPPSLYPSLLC